MALYLRELRGNMRSFIIWTVCIIVLMALMMAMYPSFAEQGDTLGEMIASFPPEMTEMLGFDALDFTQTMDYYAYIYQYLLLAVMIQFMLLGANMVSREEDAGTISFLYAKPISRSAIVGMKFLAGLTAIAAFFIIYTAAAGVMLSAVGTSGFDFGKLLVLNAGMALAQLMMLALGFLLSMFLIRARAVMSASIGVVLALYVIKLFVNINEELGVLAYITPFEYFDARALLGGGIEWIYILLSTGVSAIALAATVTIYRRKDLRC